MEIKGAAAGLLVLFATGTASAKDTDACGKDLVCASAPTSVAAAMMRAGYQALIEKDDLGDPKINSAANGYNFQVLFYGCEEHTACDSLQFHIAFTPDPRRDDGYANEWNGRKRFSQMSVDKDGSPRITYDVATIGGLTQRNFSDVLDWWTSMLAEAGKFSDAHPGGAAADPQKAAAVARPAGG